MGGRKEKLYEDLNQPNRNKVLQAKMNQVLQKRLTMWNGKIGGLLLPDHRMELKECSKKY